jgi:heme exporter protein D
LSYVIAAYAISIGAVALYFVHLVRERGRLQRALDESLL